jgi:hypothetical protein
MEIRKLLFGIFIAPLIPAILFKLIYLIFDTGNDFDIVIIAFFILYSYIIEILWVLPVYFLFKRLNFNSLIHYIIVGFIGGIIGLVISKLILNWKIATFAVLWGMTIALSFWIIVINDRRDVGRNK